MGIRFFLAAIALLLLASFTAHANGVKIPQVGYPTLPEIPRQTALITYKDGVETLVVESSYQTDSPQVQWILPVPANPDKIDVADKDMLTSISMSLRPKVIHGLRQELHAALVGIFIVSIIGYLINRSDKGWHAFVRVVLCVLVIMLLFSILLPALNSAGTAVLDNPSVNILSASQVGNYEVVVLDAKTPESLDAYLKDNGFAPLPAAASGAIKDYIQNKWVFLAAKLISDDKGLRTPHPLSVQFKTQKPVFPMRLTAIANTNTLVDLFVVANEQASAKHFETRSADQYAITTERFSNAPCYRADHADMFLGNPDAQKLLWPGCVITHLQANLTPAMMDHDVKLDLSIVVSPTRKTFYSKTGRNDATYLALTCAALPPILIIIYACRIRQKPTRGNIRAALIAALLGLIAVPIVRYLYPVIDVNSTRSYHARTYGIRFRYLLSEIMDAPPTLENVRAFTMKVIEEREYINPFTGKPMTESKLPGDYQIRQEGDDIKLYYYTDNGTEVPADLVNPIKLRH